MNYAKIRRYADLVIVIIGTVLLSYLFFKYVFIYLLPFFAGWFIAFALRPLGARLSPHLGLKPRAVRLVLTVLLSAALLGAIVLGVWLLSREAWELLEGLADGESVLYDVLVGIGDSGKLFGRIFGDLGERIADAVYRVATSMLSSAATVLTSALSRVPRVLLFLLVSVISSAYFAVGLEEINASVKRLLPRPAFDKLVWLKDGFFGAFLRYMRSYLLLLVITFFEMLLGLSLIRAPYPLIMALVIAVLDLLPVIGVGFVLIPWGVWSVAIGATPFGIGLLVLFAVHTVIRQIIEPRIVGKNLGVHPLVTLLFIYVGYSLFGAVGILLVPVFTILTKISLGKEYAAEVSERSCGEGDDA